MLAESLLVLQVYHTHCYRCGVAWRQSLFCYDPTPTKFLLMKVKPWSRLEFLFFVLDSFNLQLFFPAPILCCFWLIVGSHRGVLCCYDPGVVCLTMGRCQRANARNHRWLQFKNCWIAFLFLTVILWSRTATSLIPSPLFLLLSV